MSQCQYILKQINSFLIIYNQFAIIGEHQQMNQYPQLHEPSHVDIDIQNSETSSNSPIGRVYLRQLTGQIHTLEVNFQTETVGSVLEQLAKKLKIDKNMIRLIYSGLQLKVLSATLAESNIKKQSSIHILFRIPPVNPNPINNEFKQGLNLQAYCSNCKLVRFIPFGFKKFNIGKIIFECKCPKCGQQTEQATNFGFFETRYTIWGKKDSDKKGFINENRCEDGNYHPFLTGKFKMEALNYIEVVTYPLDK